MKYQGEGKYIKKTGGLGSHGHVVIELSANERGEGNTIVTFYKNARPEYLEFMEECDD